MDLLQLRYFKKVAELEHISQAAEQLMISQPSLSKTIRHLETELNVELFDRRGKNIFINSNGEIVNKYTTRILQSIEDMLLELNDNVHQKEHTITLHANAAIEAIPRYVIGFKKLHPEISINIKQNTSDLSEHSDFDFIIDTSKEKMKRSNVITLLEEPCSLAISKKHPLADRENITLQDFKKDSFLILRDRRPLSLILNEICDKAGFVPNIGLTCDNWEAIYSMVEAGIGVSLIPAITWNLSNHKHDLSMKKLSPPVYRYINLSWKQDAYLSEPAKIFRTYITQFFEELMQNKSTI
ncbi:MAG: LysR family transcriptional regulator [Clostridiales bacterium]|nr:LysR family transcriptional regulator [Clostridiales bacterium]